MANNFFKIDKGLNLPTRTLPVTPTEGDVAKDLADNKFKFYENGVWKKLGSGSGSGTGAEVVDLKYRAELQDSLSEPIIGGLTPIDISTNKTDASNFNSANEYIRFSYDAAKTVTGTGTSMTLSAAPAFTVKVGDVIVVGGEVREITVLGSINTSGAGFTIASAFTTNPAAAQATVSQAVYTVDLNAFTAGGTGLSVASQITDNVSTVLVNYEDSTTVSDIIPDLGSVPVIAYSVTADNSTWSTPRVRPTSLTGQLASVAVPSAGTQFRIRFFANKTSGTGLVNLLGYRAFWHEQLSDVYGSTYNTAFARPTAALYVNSSHAVVSGKSRFTFPFSYGFGLNSGNPSGSALEVYVNGQQLPRYVASITDATQGYFTEISDSVIELDTDYSAAGLEFIFKVPVTVVDSSTQNTSRIATLELNPNPNPNYCINGNFDFWQRTASLSASVTGLLAADRFKEILVGSTSVVTRQPTLGTESFSSRYFKRTVVTSVAGVNNFNTTCTRIEDVRTLANRYVTVSFWAKADSSKNMSFDVYQDFGTGGSPSSPVTLIAVQKYALTTSWQKFTKTILMPSISGKTLGTNEDSFTCFSFWYDAGSTYNSRTDSLGQQSGTFDIAQVKIEEGQSATPFVLSGITFAGELVNCQRYYEKSHEQATPIGSAGVEDQAGSVVGGVLIGMRTNFKVQKRASPTVVIYNENDGSSNSFRTQSSAGTLTNRVPTVSQDSRGLNISVTTTDVRALYHFTADAEL